jgi:hypothetical protein
MATITFSLNSAPLTASKTYTSTDADMQSLLDHGRIVNAALILEMFHTSTPTNAQIAAAMVQAVINQWIAQTQVVLSTPPPPMGWS